MKDNIDAVVKDFEKSGALFMMLFYQEITKQIIKNGIN